MTQIAQTRPAGGTANAVARSTKAAVQVTQAAEAPQQYLTFLLGGEMFPSAATSIASADLNGDGKADIVSAAVGANKVYVALNNGDGTTAAPRAYDTDRGPSAVALADVTGDGKLDLLVANYDSGSVSLLPGNGDGSFQPQRVFPGGIL